MALTRLMFNDLVKFSRKYRFVGAKVRRVRLDTRKGVTTIELTLRISPATQKLNETRKPIWLKLRFVGVEEYRIQQRLGMPGGRTRDGRFGYFDGRFYATFDTWSLESNEQPGVHDFRNSELYFAARELWWDEPISK